MATAAVQQPADELCARVLGALQVSGPGGTLQPRAGKHRVVLAGLLLRANQVVTVPELISWLWDFTPPQTARQTLYVYLMRLRKEMTRVLGDRVRIDTVPAGYLLTIDPTAVDVLVFRQLVEQAHTRQLDGQPEQAVRLLRQAERLWRGPALADVPSDRLQHDEVTGLTEEWARAVERRIELELSLGLHNTLVGELRALTAKHPLRERLWALLMLALYRDGRQADALACYQQVRELLVDEVGLEPGGDLRQLQQQILAGEVAEPAPSTSPADARANWVPQHQLPPWTMDFVGRTQETERITHALTGADQAGAVPVVVVSGPPGVGKSTLAIHAAHTLGDQFPDGQWYVHCGGSTGPLLADDLIGDLLRLSGLHPRDLPDSPQARVATLRARLAGRRVLLVVDDATDLDQVTPLLPGTAGCAVLVTSRRLLAALLGAVPVRLEPLPPAEAEQLLTGLVGRPRADAEPIALRDIVALCGHLPLALRIAGARLQARPAAALGTFAAALRDQTRRLNELELGSLSVRASIELSYAALDSTAQLALRRLGLLGGGDFPAWVPAVLTGVADPEPLIERLTGASLVTATGRDRTGEPRYRLPDLVGVYAAELAGDTPTGDDLAALRRLLDTLVQLSSAAWQRLRGGSWGWLQQESAPAVEVLDAEHAARLLRDELAWEQAERRLVLFMVDAACRHGWYVDAAKLAGHFCVPTYREYARMQEAVHAAAISAGDELTRWRAEFARARHFVHQRSEVAVRRLTSCLRGFERIGAERDAGQVLSWLSLCHLLADQPAEARQCAERALAIARAMGADDIEAMALPKLARALALADRYPEAVELFEQAWLASDQINDLAYRWTVLNRLSYLARRAGDLDRAQWAAEQGLMMTSSGAEPSATGWMLCLLARVLIVRGEHQRAAELAAHASELFASVGDHRGRAAAEVVVGVTHIARGARDVAIPFLESALPAYLDSGEEIPAGEIRKLLKAAREGDAMVDSCALR